RPGRRVGQARKAATSRRTPKADSRPIHSRSHQQPTLADVTLAAILALMIQKFPLKIFDLPPYRESVDKIVSTENLKAVASRTTDPQVLLGLAFLDRVGSPVRQEISEMAVNAKPEYATIVAVLAITLDAIDEQSIAELIRRDPDNALGYYLQ